MFEEVSPFFSEERRLLHAGRAICITGARRPAAAGRPGGRALDARLRQPVVRLGAEPLRRAAPVRPHGAGPPPHTPVNFYVYGWSGKVLYSSESRAGR